MSELPPPATGVELYLDAILGELRALRAAVEGGVQEQEPGLPDDSEPLFAGLVHEAQAPSPEAVAAATTDSPASTKRTRARNR